MNGDVIQVDLLSIDITQAQVDVDIAVGALVAVEGLLRIDGTIAANTVTAYAPPATSVTAVVGAIPTTETAFTPTPPAPAAASMVIVGPLQTVTATRITIYGIEIQLDPTVPLPPLRVGEMVRVQAEQVDGVIVARNIIYDPSS